MVPVRIRVIPYAVQDQVKCQSGELRVKMIVPKASIRSPRAGELLIKAPAQIIVLSSPQVPEVAARDYTTHWANAARMIA